LNITKERGQKKFKRFRAF